MARIIKADIRNWLIAPATRTEKTEDLLKFYDFLVDLNKERFEFSSNYMIEGEAHNYEDDSKGKIRTSPIKEIIRRKNDLYVKTARQSTYRIQTNYMDSTVAKSIREYCEHGVVFTIPKFRYKL